MFGPVVPKSQFAWPLKSRVIDTSSGASWRFPELEGGTGRQWDVTSSCWPKPRRARLPSDRRTPVIAQNSCHWPAQAAPEVRPAKLPSSWSDLFSVWVSLRWAESYSFLGKWPQKSIFFGDKSEENPPQLSDQRVQFFDSEASLAPTPLSRLIGW